MQFDAFTKEQQYINLFLNKTNLDDRYEYLYGACEEPHVGAFKAIIKSNTVPQYNVDIMHYACKGGNIEIINIMSKLCTEYIQSVGDDMEKLWLCGLEGACEGGHLNLVKTCIDNIKYEWSPSKCLWHACISGNMEVIEYIIGYGNVDWGKGLNGACKGGNLHVVEYMIKNGPGPNYGWKDDLEIACVGGHIEVIKFMVEKIIKFMGTGKYIKVYLNSCLTTACREGHVDIVKYMLSHGVTDKKNSLAAACIGGNIDIVNLMIKNGSTNWNKGLKNACKKGHIEIAKFMLSKGATMDFSRGFIDACVNGHIEIVRLMIEKCEEKGTEMDFDQGFNEACFYRDVDIANLVIEKGIDFINLETALGYACHANFVEIVKLMIEKGVTKNKETLNFAMLSACGEGSEDIIELLINEGISDWEGSLFATCMSVSSMHIDAQLGIKIINILFKYGGYALGPEALDSPLVVTTDVDAQILLINKGAELKPDSSIITDLHLTRSFNLYCLCCTQNKYTLDPVKYLELLLMYPPYVLLVMSRLDTKYCVSKLPVELFRLLFTF